MTRIRRLALLFVAFMLPGCAAPEDAPSFAALWAKATQKDGCVPQNHHDFIIGVCPDKLTFWYFTKPNHPAHPGVIRREFTQGADGWYAHEDGWSFAPDSRQQAFKDWLAQFQELDRQLKDYIARKKSTPPS